MSTIPGLDQVMQGLGLAGQAQSPAPAVAPTQGGLGLAQPQAPVTRQAGLLDTPGAEGPEDLSDIGLGRKVLLKLGNFAAGVHGDAMPTQILRQQRQQQNDRRSQAMQQAMTLAGKFGEELDRTPMAELPKKQALLRKRYAELAGTGGEEMFDAFVGDPGAWMGKITAASQDPEFQAAVQNPAFSPEMVREYMAKPETLARAAAIQGEQQMKDIVPRLQEQFAHPPSPAYRDAYEKAVKDGPLTVDKIIALQEHVPEAQRLKNSEIYTVTQHEASLEGVIKNFRARPQVAANANKEDDLDRTSERDLQLHKYRMEELGQQAKNKPAPGAKLAKFHWDAANYGKRLEQSMGDMESVIESGFKREEYVPSMGRFLPGAVKPEGLMRQEQAEENFINATLRKESGAAISPSEFEKAEKQYFPRAGNTPEVLAQKARNRRQQLESLRAEAGDAWDQIPLITADAPNGSAGHTAAPGAAPAANEVVRNVKGRPAVYDATTKKFLRWK